MVGRQSPLRIAFWATLSALWLTLFLALSDPYSIRQTMLAQQGPVRANHPSSRGAEPLLAQQPPSPIGAMPTDDAGGTAMPAATAIQDAPMSLAQHPSVSPVSVSSVSVSAVPARVVHRQAPADDRRTMPRSTPAESHRPDERRALTASLPPAAAIVDPPSMNAPVEEDDGDTRIPDPISLADVQNPTLVDPLPSEATLLNEIRQLRLQIRQLEQACSAQRLAEVHQQQAQLAERQQQTAGRLEELSRQLESRESPRENDAIDLPGPALPPVASGPHREEAVR